MSKRKIQLLSDANKNSNAEPNAKKEKTESLANNNNNTTKNKTEQKKVELSKTENEDVKVEEKDSQRNGKEKRAEDSKSNCGKKRKREETEIEKEETKKVIKADKEVAKNEKNDTFGAAKKIFKKRISKNECLCTPVEDQRPLQKSEDDAHIQVEEWRLHKFQSPIELKHDESIHHDHFDPLEFHGHWDDSGEATLTNNGFTATLRFFDRELPLLKGGPLHEDAFVFEQLHFHWSEDDHSGCEHIFEGRAYSMEAHAVHFNQKYKDFQEAHDKPDGVAVVAFFIQATDNEDNPCFNKLATAVKDIIKINTTTKVPADCLTWFKEEAQCKGYYTYQGSLTTEPYTESVTWILYPQCIHVSREQVASFRSLKSTPCEKHNIKQNVRPIQTPPEHKKLNVLYARSHRPSTSE